MPARAIIGGPVGRKKLLNRRSRVVLDTLLPSGAHARLPGGLDAGVPEFLDELRRSGPPLYRLGLRAGMASAVWIAPLLIGRPPPITLYGRETRQRALEALGRSRVYPIRSAFAGLKLAVSLGYGADPSVRRAIGYPAPSGGAPT